MVRGIYSATRQFFSTTALHLLCRGFCTSVVFIIFLRIRIKDVCGFNVWGLHYFIIFYTGNISSELKRMHTS